MGFRAWGLRVDGVEGCGAPCPVRVVYLGRSTCHAISGRGGLVNWDSGR